MVDENTAIRTLARIEEKVDNVLNAVSELKSDMKESRTHRNELDRRVTKLETKMDDVDTVKKAFIGVVVGFIVILIGIAAVFIQYIQMAH